MGFVLTEKEYIALYPERVKGGRIYCGCGASNIRLLSNALYVCAVCNMALFISTNYSMNGGKNEKD